MSNWKKGILEPKPKSSWLYFTGFPKITIVFGVLFVIVITNAWINFYYISKDKQNLQKITEVIQPYLNQIDQLNVLLIESKMYTTNWVYLPYSTEDKSKLDSIHRYTYPALKTGIVNKTQLIQHHFADFKHTNAINKIFNEWEKIIIKQKKVMQTLANFDDYENPNKKFEAEDIIESELLPETKTVQLKLQHLNTLVKVESVKLKQSIMDDYLYITNVLIILSIALVFSIVISIYIMVLNIRRPSYDMKNVIDGLSRGELPEAHIKASDNIIGEMADSLNQLTENFKKTALFAKEIESGNFNVSFQKLSNNDHLGEALLSMRESLKSYANEMELKIKQRTEEVTLKSKEIELQKLFYESVLSSIPLEIAVYDHEKKYIFINQVNNHYDANKNFLIGKTDIEFCSQQNIDSTFALKRDQYMNLAIQTNATTEFEDNLNQTTGHDIWKIRRFTPVFAEGQFKYMIAYAMDVTRLKNQEILIKESLDEKESLLGEIHHRVKNNLTLVLGLIEMQRESQSDDKIKNQFSEIKNRIFAMSLIHDKMYKSHSFANIELSEYLKDLVMSVARFYGKDKFVQLKFDLQSVAIKGKDAIPVALLINEVVTNSFKYAFNINDAKQSAQGILCVGLHKNADSSEEIILTVKDNGAGLPAELDIAQSKSLGFKLIHIFVRQLKGELNYFNDNGLTFVIKFKISTQ